MPNRAEDAEDADERRFPGGAARGSRTPTPLPGLLDDWLRDRYGRPPPTMVGERAGSRATGATRDDMLGQLTRHCQGRDPRTMAVVYPVDDLALRGAVEARRAGIVTLVLTGPRAQIQRAARRAGIDIEGCAVLDAKDEQQATRAGVEAVRQGRAALLMKGSVHTSTFLSEVLHHTSHLRGRGRASHVFVLSVPGIDRLLFVTDAVLNVAPDLATKADICRNAVELAVALGVATPKVAVLSAAEDVDPLVPSTLDAAALTEMATRGQIPGATVDGPLALDDAISPRALEAKHIRSPLRGEADILVAPTLEAANICYKALVHVAGALAAGIVVGTKVPVIVAGRADSVETRVASAALGCLWAARDDPVEGSRTGRAQRDERL